MSSQKWSDSAPSNIALIKYMGKTDHQQNAATNASLSYTLDHLRTYVEMELSEEEESDRWEPLELENSQKLSLSEKGQTRFLKHLERLKNHFNVRQNFIVRSANDFPSDCGLASSASSFAALTLCAYRVLSELCSKNVDRTSSEVLSEVSSLSRQGSGSSCRSLYRPWAMWRGEAAEKVTGLPESLLHMAVIVSDGVKSISSSEAHRLVSQSLLFEGRIERAEKRLKQLLHSLRHGEWHQAFEIIWAEFWDMHALFETSQPTFGYMTPGSLQVLQYVRESWKQDGDGPLCTMDAGPNVHLLFRSDQKAMAQKYNSELQKSTFQTYVNF